MSTTPPRYAYALALLYGIAVFLIPVTEPLPIFFALFYFFGGVLLGFIWPRLSWRWGLWIAGPILVLLGLSVLFAGQLEVFIRKDLPLLLLALAVACLGSFVSSWFKRRKQASL